MLRDHFHPPLSSQHDWRSFHYAWATTLAFDLNKQLPDGWYAAPSVEFGIEVDVGAWELSSQSAVNSGNRVVETREWEMPQPTLTIDFPMTTDVVEVLIYETSAGRVLAGGIELVSPANKDRQEHRDAFVSKCESKLRDGVALVVVDLVTSRYANLHNVLLARIGYESAVSPNERLYAASYRPTARDEHTVLDIWKEPLSIGCSLPKLPLHLMDGPRLQVDLESTYEQTRTSLLIP